MTITHILPASHIVDGTAVLDSVDCLKDVENVI